MTIVVWNSKNWLFTYLVIELLGIENMWKKVCINFSLYTHYKQSVLPNSFVFCFLQIPHLTIKVIYLKHNN